VRVALIFDLDGTLAETRHDIAASANAALTAVGLPAIPEDVVTTYVGEGASKLIERCVGARRDLHAAALAAWTEHYARNLLVTTRLYEGVAETLDTLPGPLAVLSNKPEGMSRAILQGLGILARFDAVLGGDSLPVKKPDPAGIRTILGTLKAERAVLIGDSLIDLETARAADVPLWAAAYGFLGEETLVRAGAKTVFHAFREIVALRRELDRVS